MKYTVVRRKIIEIGQLFALPAFLLSTIYCLLSTPVSAQNFEGSLGTIKPPAPVEKLNGGDPTGVTGLNNFLSTLVGLFFTFSAVVCAFMIFWAAFDYITSHGEKDNISKARQKLTWAIFGLILLSLSFVIFRILGFVTGIEFLIK